MLLQAQALLGVFAVVLATELAVALVTKFVLELKASEEEEALGKQVATLEVEARRVNLPATFMQWAKIKRKAVALERDQLKLSEARAQEAKASWRKRTAQALSWRMLLLSALLFYGVEASLPPAPLLELDAYWMWPMGRLLALPNYSSGALSVVGWSLVSQKVCARLCNSVIGV